jgi:hypothetical protein
LGPQFLFPQLLFPQPGQGFVVPVVLLAGLVEQVGIVGLVEQVGIVGLFLVPDLLDLDLDLFLGLDLYLGLDLFLGPGPGPVELYLGFYLDPGFLGPGLLGLGLDIFGRSF